MIFTIIGCARSLHLRHYEGMPNPQRGSRSKLAATKMSLPNNKKISKTTLLRFDPIEHEGEGKKIKRIKHIKIKKVW